MYAYNPRKKSYRRLEKTLVGSDRWEILNNILKELTIKDGEAPKQHWMLVGPRGIGKSHLMTLLYFKIKDAPELNKLWIPVLFPEEIRMATNLSRFLERTVNEILIELEEEKNQISKELKQKIIKVRNVSISERIDNFFSLISWIHEKTGKFIVLITENLQQLLGKKLPVIEQKKLRAFLQTSDALLIIGSATTIFNALHDHSHPFYHFFHIRRMEDLEFDDMKTLIFDLLSESENSEFAKDVIVEDARLKTLYAFTGGNPRMAVFLSDILKTQISDEMLNVMDIILDELTPYFESILKEVPDYLQEIINTLATFEPAQSPKEISYYLEAPQPTIRNYMKQLKENGYVRIAFSKGKSNYYCLNEYLYRIWYQMRDSSHREETRWIMELLLMLYSPATIVKERSKLKANINVERPTSSYEKLIVQTADFVTHNPDYCKIIELCIDSTINDEKGIVTNTEEKELLEEAYNYIENDQYDDALKVCKNFLNTNSRSYIALCLIGECYRELGQYDEAEINFEKAITINPDYASAHFVWGVCLGDQKKYKKAIGKFKKAIKLDPELYGGHRAIGKCYMELGQYGEAEINFEKAITINPDYVDAYFALGVCLRDQKRFDEAIEKFKKVIKLNPKSERGYWYWGACLREQKKYKEAIGKFKKVIKLDPEPYAGHGALGDCYRHLKQHAKAEKNYEKAIEINPDYIEAYFAWGACLRDQKRYNEAIDIVKKVIEFNPKSSIAYCNWSNYLIAQKQYKEAIEKFKKAIKLNSKSYASHGALGECYRRLGQHAEAEINYKKAIEINPDYVDAYSSWSNCLREQKRFDEAIKKIKTTLKIFPKSDGAYWSWGACLRDQKKYKEAIEKFKKAIRLDEEPYAGHGAIGDCYKYLGQHAEAEINYKKAIEIDPDYVDVYVAWGDCLRRQKNYEEAIGLLKKAIKLSPKHEDAYALWGECLYEQGKFEEAIHLFEKYFPESKDNDVICSYGRSLMGMEGYDEALEQFELIIKNEPEYDKLYLYFGQLLEKMSNSEFALIAYLKHINLDYVIPSADFDFQKTCGKLIFPLINKLKPSDYIKQFYVSKKERKFSESQLSIFLILLDQYDTVSEHFQDILRKHMGKSDKEKDDFNLLIFTLKLSIWHKLFEGNRHDALRLMDLYIEYIKTLKKTAQKENEVSDFFLSLFKLQINLDVDPKDIKETLQQFKNQKDIPFSTIFSKVWTCLSEPDSVEAQRFVNDKAIAEVVKEIKN
jgi:tetratricopeptide (TPR) repeat protein